MMLLKENATVTIVHSKSLDVERLMEEDMLQPLDYSYMTNLDELDPGVVALRDEYDPDGVYSMP